MKTAPHLVMGFGMMLALTACSSAQSESGVNAPTRQVTVAVACQDADSYLPTALSIVFSGKDVWDAARQKGQDLLSEETTEPEVTAAIHDLGNAGIALADATEKIAGDSPAGAGQSTTDRSTMEPLAQPMEALTTAGDRVSDTC